jgi:hypothetical protein
MHHISRSKAVLLRNGTIKSYEYDMPSEALNVAVIYVNGRYPLTDFTINTQVESIIQVIKGTGTIGLIDGTIIALKKGDQAYIAKNESYFFEGAFELVYAATPKWTAQQTGHVSDLKPSAKSY